MTRMLLFTTLILAAVVPSRAVPERTMTRTGWFSDEGCAAAKLKADDITPNGTACVKRCLDDGALAVFVDPAARAMYQVKGFAAVKDHVGYYLEVTGTISEDTGTISITTVKRLGDVIQMCGRPRKK